MEHFLGRITQWRVTYLLIRIYLVTINKYLLQIFSSDYLQQKYKKGMNSSYHWVCRTYMNMSVHYLKIEVTKYICPLLRVPIQNSPPNQVHNSWIFVYMLPLKVPKLLIITEHFLYIMLTKFKTKHPPFMSL